MGIHFNHKSKAGDRKMEKALKLKQKADEWRHNGSKEMQPESNRDDVTDDNDVDTDDGDEEK